MIDRSEELLTRLRRHVGHQLRCVHDTSGEIAGWVVETVALRCDDCGEVVLEATKQVRKHARPR